MTRWPWERDPDDREANYTRPISTSDKVRLVLKAASVVVAFLWFRAQSGDGEGEGAALAVATGSVFALVGVVDGIAAWRGEVEAVFLERRSHQVSARIALLLAGVGLVVAGASA